MTGQWLLIPTSTIIPTSSYTAGNRAYNYCDCRAEQQGVVLQYRIKQMLMDGRSVELCPRCRASTALTSHKLPFEEDFARAYHNPSSTETAVIQGSLSEPIAELARLAEEIQRTELLLHALKTHRAHLETHIHRATRFLQFSPIRELPTEVLDIIFAFACSSCQEDEYKTPLSISLVCSKWRHIAISTPTLWTNIYVAPYSSARGLPVYQYFLRRCGMIPISVKVEVPARNYPAQDDDEDVLPFEETYQHHVSVMGDIYASFSQWQHAEFHMKEADILLLEDLDDRWRPQMKQADPPILESLTLALKDVSDSSRLPRIFKDARLLSSVNIIDCRQTKSLLRITSGLPWASIRCVQTNRRDTADLYYMRYNSDFQDGTLILNATNQKPTYYTHSPLACLLKTTTTLILDRPWTNALREFLLYAIMPTLEALTIISRDPKNKDPRSGCNPLIVLPFFMEHTQGRLNTFRLMMHGWFDEFKGEPTLADSLVNVLRGMGDLKFLQVVESNVGPPVLGKRLFEELYAGALLPELTSLELVWAESHQPERELFSALSSRADGRLSSLVLGIRNGGNLGLDILECMRGLRENGVQATCW